MEPRPGRRVRGGPVQRQGSGSAAASTSTTPTGSASSTAARGYAPRPDLLPLDPRLPLRPELVKGTTMTQEDASGAFSPRPDRQPSKAAAPAPASGAPSEAAADVPRVRQARPRRRTGQRARRRARRKARRRAEGRRTATAAHLRRDRSCPTRSRRRRRRGTAAAPAPSSTSGCASGSAADRLSVVDSHLVDGPLARTTASRRPTPTRSRSTTGCCTPGALPDLGVQRSFVNPNAPRTSSGTPLHRAGDLRVLRARAGRTR